jgi:hypothetical protein
MEEDGTIHGEFKQKLSQHLSSHGCPNCAGWYKTTDQFIQEAKLIYGNK